ncbi:preprotein translocase subunit SecE [Chitinimonas arctica]|uniref:Protein translocase subunit SecE n=1 Tax=Chitinimonas arctica TaxID=2594795 RepID=A0A516SE06_9NEIS|nr:preprotein translocase subunit SecE [Chitinimonas arctica]QDQ26396.1 preprotein translocase subunit SecE [Chitinimonas arctica]
MENVDKLKLVGAFLLVAAGVAGFYLLPLDQQALRVVAVVAGVLLAATVIWFSAPGREFVDYARDSIKEAEKVVWPTRKETWQVTGVVFLFAFTLAIFMWAVDSGLAWLFYDVLLKRV